MQSFIVLTSLVSELVGGGGGGGGGYHLSPQGLISGVLSIMYFSCVSIMTLY